MSELTPEMMSADREVAVQQLMEMGFGRDQVVAALRRHGGNSEAALNELLLAVTAENPPPPPSLRQGLESLRLQDVPPLGADANADAAFAYLKSAVGDRDISSTVLAALLRLLRANASYAHLQLPAGDAALDEYASRMHSIADVNFDGNLSATEFRLFWRNLPTSTAASVLSDQYLAKMAAPAASFVFGSRGDWVGGLQQKLGGLVTRSVAVECMTNDGGLWAQEYEYITQQPAQSLRTGEYDAHGHEIILDEGHDGLTLADFQQLAAQRGAQLNLVEVAVVRMYSSRFYKPWSACSPTLQLYFSLPAPLSFGSFVSRIPSHYALLRSYLEHLAYPSDR